MFLADTYTCPMGGPVMYFLVMSSLGFTARLGSAFFAFLELNVIYTPQDPHLVLHLPTRMIACRYPTCIPSRGRNWFGIKWATIHTAAQLLLLWKLHCSISGHFMPTFLDFWGLVLFKLLITFNFFIFPKILAKMSNYQLIHKFKMLLNFVHQVKVQNGPLS